MRDPAGLQASAMHRRLPSQPAMVRISQRRSLTMDGVRFPSSPMSSRLLSRPINRRRVVGGAAGAGLAAALGGVPSLAGPGRAAAADGSSLQLVNPASRVLLPGEAGLSEFGLDFALAGPPAVFFASSDTPGWSDDVKTSVGGFAFGYASMLTDGSRSSSSGRAVQTCVHHGFSSKNDAEIAWTSLIAALTSAGRSADKAEVRSLDLVELIIVEGQSILASVSSAGVSAIVLASRSGTDLVTVAIADFTGRQPSADEALSLAEAEGEKLNWSRQIERTNLTNAFAGQWTPGFQLGSSSGAPFFAWPTQLSGSPVKMTGESSDQYTLRRQSNALVQHQSHIEGPFWESNPAFSTHALYYSAQSNFFSSSSEVKSYHGQTEERLRASMLDVTVTKIKGSSFERRFGYETITSYGALTGITLHRVVTDGTFPVSLAIHIIAVPYYADSAALTVDEIFDRLDRALGEMRDGLESCLVTPERSPLIIQVSPIA